MRELVLHPERLDGLADPFDALLRWRAAESAATTGGSGASRRAILLEGPAGRPSKHAWLALDPIEGVADLVDLGALRERLAAFRVRAAAPLPGPFAGGFVGSIAYDLGPSGEALQLPRDPWEWPTFLGGVFGDFVYWDREAHKAWLVTAECDGLSPRAERRERILARLAQPAPELAPCRLVDMPLRETSRAQHIDRIERARAWIRDGEFYQANVSHRMGCRVEGDPLALYAALRRSNPAPYMGFLEHGSGALLSSSPELLLEFDGRTARSRPIKGTARRSSDPAADLRAAAALRTSAKDAAELAMIVDLVRNDLGRVARTGGVRVEARAELESFAHVHHLVATVAADVAPDVDAFAVLAALFPGGSITGAPKLRAMEAIAELEGEGRGPFTGSLGWIGFDGRACFNILIRTVLVRSLGNAQHEVSFRVGGGITWRSDARAEDDETMDKALGLLGALAATKEVDRV